jgi:hypothetical protein
MKPEKIYTLSNGEEITASQLSLKLNITTRAARNRLNKYSQVEQVFKSTSELQGATKAKIYTLSNGMTGTVCFFARLAGLKEDTIRQRLANSNDYKKVLAKQTIKAKLYTLPDETKVTVQDYASSMNITAEQAEQCLNDIAIFCEVSQKVFELSDGKCVTIADIVEAAGVSINTAKARIKASLDTSFVLKPTKKSITKNAIHMFSCHKTGNLVKQPIYQ